MLMEFADVSRAAAAVATIAERLLREPLAVVERAGDGHGRTLPPSVVNCASCTGVTAPSGNSTITRVPATPKNACATALPVSPDVATRTVSGASPLLKWAISRAMTRAPTSLKANVGPWNSSSDVQAIVHRARAASGIQRVSEQPAESAIGHFAAEQRAATAVAMSASDAPRSDSTGSVERRGHVEAAVGRQPVEQGRTNETSGDWPRVLRKVI